MTDMIAECDRLAKVAGAQALEIAELRKQVAERDALLVEKDAALKETQNFKVLPIGLTMRIKHALSKTLPSEALERALAAEREQKEEVIK
jgi:hypothetical protein